MTETQANIIIALLCLVVFLLAFGFAGVESELERIRTLQEEKLERLSQTGSWEEHLDTHLDAHREALRGDRSPEDPC